MILRKTNLLIMFVCFYICHGQQVGNSCVIRRTKQPGVCTLLDNCETAKAELKQGYRPTQCGFEGNKPVVCCQKQTGRKSKQKCNEYKKKIEENNLSCKKPYLHLIVNGENVKPKEFPHQALLGYGSSNNKEWRCGGSLISEKFILTAAHCCSPTDPPRYILLGEYDISKTDDDASPEEYNVDNIIRHPGYQPPLRYNDIALIELDRRVTFNEYIHPACLYNAKKMITGNFIATGWGKTDYLNSAGSNILQKVNIEEFSYDECKEFYRPNRQLRNSIDDKSQLCAGGRKEAKDSCKGDSGGPLQIKISKCVSEIVGITSLGKGCGTAGVPAIYTRVSNYIEWIEDIVWPN